MIIGMLNINGKISRDVSCDDTIWLRRPELKAKKVFNRQISRSWDLLMEVICRFKRGKVTWDQWVGRWKGKCFWSKDRSSKSEHRYWLVVRLKAIRYKENFLYYLSPTASLYLYSLFIIFVVSRRSPPYCLRIYKFHLLHRLTTHSGPHYQDTFW